MEQWAAPGVLGLGAVFRLSKALVFEPSMIFDPSGMRFSIRGNPDEPYAYNGAAI
jgi:hypothetical protein